MKNAVCTILAILCCASLIPHAAALENNIAHPIAPQHVRQGQAMQNFLVRIWLLLSATALTASTNLPGPLMGVTSMLWLVMRNDPAINPHLSWMVFGVWLFFGLAYFMLQCHRVSNHRRYIFTSLTLAYFCTCITALLQRSSPQSALVTSTPICASFAVYSVAYFSPKRREETCDDVV